MGKNKLESSLELPGTDHYRRGKEYEIGRKSNQVLGVMHLLPGKGSIFGFL